MQNKVPDSPQTPAIYLTLLTTIAANDLYHCFFPQNPSAAALRTLAALSPELAMAGGTPESLETAEVQVRQGLLSEVIGI
jgi:hypothetical protein